MGGTAEWPSRSKSVQQTHRIDDMDDSPRLEQHLDRLEVPQIRSEVQRGPLALQQICKRCSNTGSMCIGADTYVVYLTRQSVRLQSSR